MTNINFLLTLSKHNQEKKLWEFMKKSSKGKCFDLLSNSLNVFFMESCRDQFTEFVFGYWATVKPGQAFPSLTSRPKLFRLPAIFSTGEREERGVHIWQGFCLLVQSTFDYWIEARSEYCIIHFVNKLRNQRTETICY